MPNLTVSSNVDTMLAAADNAAIRTAIGLGTTANPTFANLALTSSSLSADAPVTISQTWNNAAVAFTGLKVNAVSTDSLTTSRLLDLQVGGVSLANFSKAGHLIFPSSSTVTPSGPGVGQWVGTLGLFGSGGSLLVTGSGAALNISSNVVLSWNNDTILLRDGAANTLALRNGAAAQTFRVYNTYSNAGVDVEYLQLSTTASGFRVGTNSSGSGSSRPLFLGVGGGSQWQINTAGHIGTFGSDNLYDIGANGANRPRNVYVGSNIYAAGNVGIGTTAPASALHISGALGSNITTYDSAAALKLTNTTGNSSWLLTSGVIGVVNASFSIRRDTVALPALTISSTDNVGIGTTSPTSKLHVAGDVTLPSGGSIFFGGGYNIYGTTTATTINGPTAFGQVAVAVNGVTKWVFNYDGLLCGGGTTAAFPALKRSSTTVQARLADDTAFAPIQGKLTTDTAYTATVVAATGYITIYDSTGTAYRVPCAV